jgi:hypothetical protein
MSRPSQNWLNCWMASGDGSIVVCVARAKEASRSPPPHCSDPVRRCIARSTPTMAAGYKLFQSLADARVPVALLLIGAHTDIGLSVTELLDRARPGGSGRTDLGRSPAG